MTRRITKELQSLQKNPIEGFTVQEVKDISRWNITLVGVNDTIYENEVFQLQFTFSSTYPLEAPEVIFVGNHIPIHPHIYTNGHICLSILYDTWSPALSVSSVCLSILSMLSSCKEKALPTDNEKYVKNSKGKSPKQTTWWFHDDTV